MLLEAGAAENRPSLGGFKRNSRLHAAFRTGRARLRTHPLRASRPFRLALLTVLRIVLELFVVEKNLLASCKHELCAAVYTLEHSIGEFHGRLPLQGLSPKTAMAPSDGDPAGSGSLSSFVMHNQGPDRTKS